MSKVALITGITGRTGVPVRTVAGKVMMCTVSSAGRRRSIGAHRSHLQDPHQPDARFHIHYGDMTDSTT